MNLRDLLASPVVSETTRRQFLKSGALLGASLTMTPNLASLVSAQDEESEPVGSGDAGQVIIRTPGGAYEDAWREACWEPFAEETGIQVVPVATNAARIMAMVEAGATDLDILDFGEIQFEVLGERGALETLDQDRFTLTNLEDVDPVREFYVGNIVYATIMAFNTEEFADDHPSTWAEFWDAEAYPGGRMLADMATGVVDLEFALLADGVPMDELYPIDVDRAFAKLSEIREHITKWWDTGAVAAQMLADREVVLGSCWNGRVQTLADQGAPVAGEWNEAARMVQGFAIMKDAPNLDNAYSLIDYSMQPEVQANLVELIAYGPTNARAFEFIPEDLVDRMPTSPENAEKSFVHDASWWAQNGDLIAERWQEFLIGG
jgi:putative spermidine/putrescine transport system substrate-binding protein